MIGFVQCVGLASLFGRFPIIVRACKNVPKGSLETALVLDAIFYVEAHHSVPLREIFVR